MQMYEVNEVRNSQGKPILLTDQEYHNCLRLQEQVNAKEYRNALGFEIPITTLTAISKKVVEQKFFTIAPADYLPVRVGENSWSSNIITYRDFQVADDFEKGIVNQAGSTRLSTASAAIDSLSINVYNWGKEINWTLFELKQAALSGNWDVVTSKERSRKRNWDLGIQKIAFLGSATNVTILGLLNQATVASNTTVITTKISAMTDAQFQTFVATIIEAYRANCFRTAMPTHFIVPESDYNGLTTPANTNFAITSKLEYLEKAFKTATSNPNFKILPCSYADKANNQFGLNRWVLLNYDEDTIRMDIPVQYTNTQQNSINGFQYQNVGYGQFTGALAYRPAEILYFDNSV